MKCVKIFLFLNLSNLVHCLQTRDQEQKNVFKFFENHRPKTSKEDQEREFIKRRQNFIDEITTKFSSNEQRLIDALEGKNSSKSILLEEKEETEQEQEQELSETHEVYSHVLNLGHSDFLFNHFMD